MFEASISARPTAASAHPSGAVWRRWAMPGLVAIGLMSANSAAATSVTGDPVLYWNEVMLTGVPFSPAMQRPAAMLNIALHDAVNSTLGRPDRSYLGNISVPGGDTRAAAAVAARNILVALYPTRTAEFDTAMAASLALVANGAAKTNGMATGAATAAATIARRANDGSFDIISYTPSGLPGRWAPTPPGFGPPITPQQGAVDPYVIKSGDQFRAPPPPTLDSAAYVAAFNEVKAIGSVTSLTRTADQTASALFWASAQGPGPWLRAAIATSEAKGLSTIENARLMALLSTSVADAVTSVWDTKFYYDYWRPVTAIRAADFDGNDATTADLTWTPLIVTPPHPSYASAHATVSGAASTILELSFGDANPFCVTSGSSSRCWNSFSDAEMDSANSRLWGGVHWGFDNSTGMEMGEAIGQWAFASSAFDAVPEPTTWVMMLLGFGLLGTVLRHGRSTYRNSEAMISRVS